MLKLENFQAKKGLLNPSVRVKDHAQDLDQDLQCLTKVKKLAECALSPTGMILLRTKHIRTLVAIIHKFQCLYQSLVSFHFYFSEYDSEMDDFIDDSDAKIDISAEIRNIFGYDRRKFRDEVRKMILFYRMG